MALRPLVGLAILTLGMAVAAQEWAAPLEIPLPDGFVEDSVGRVEFDSPGGRVVEMIWAGPGTAAATSDFFTAALPPLGWQPQAAAEVDDKSLHRLRFIREGEGLTVEIVEAGATVMVMARLEPSGG